MTEAADNLDPRRIWATMMSNEKPGGHGERSVAVGVVDMAVWDTAAKIAPHRWRHSEVSTDPKFEEKVHEVTGVVHEPAEGCSRAVDRREDADPSARPDAEGPADEAGKDVHIILDNYAAYKHRAIREWLSKRDRWQFHSAPTSCSWPDAVE